MTRETLTIVKFQRDVGVSALSLEIKEPIAAYTTGGIADGENFVVFRFLRFIHVGEAKQWKDVFVVKRTFPGVKKFHRSSQ